jgi:hypothetical protein
VSSFEILQYDDARIVLIENYPCANKDELRKREYEIIQETENCINKIKALPEVVGLTVGEYQKWYNAQNKEYIAARQKKYAEDHKNQLQTQYKVYYQQNCVEIKAARREYASKNMDKIKARNRREIMCDCGAVIQHGYKKRHDQSFIHQEFIKMIP